MIIRSLVVGAIQTNCYILGCEETKQGAIIDPGSDVAYILQVVKELGVVVQYIINTHGHFDHTGGNRKLKEATGASIVIHPKDRPLLDNLEKTARAWGLDADDSPAPEILVEGGERLSFGEVALEVIHTPGHSPGGICLCTDGVVFVGDTLFAGSIGRTDLPGGDYEILIQSILEKLLPLGDDLRVFPGHGIITTLGRERNANPYLSQ